MTKMANSNHNKHRKKFKFNQLPLIWILVTLGIFYLLNTITLSVSGLPRDITYGEFYKVIKEEPQKIKSLMKVENELSGEFADGSRFRLNIPDNDQDLLKLIRENVVNFDVRPPRTLL